MTNETIFYLIGLALGIALGYSFRCLIAPKHTVKVLVIQKENAENEQREDRENGESH